MNKIPSDIAVGSDLELFLFDNELEKIVPCVGILDGTKDKPYRPEGYETGYAIQEDNVMVEYNIPPATNVDAFYKSMRRGRSMVLNELNRRYGSKYSLYMRGHTHTFQARQLQSDQSKTIGCEPDFDAYGGGRMRIDPPAPGLQRSCGGHVHLGGDFKCPDFVAALFAELFIGVRGGWNALPKDPRAVWYGKPGIYRPKPYGIEYRTPNNSWGRTGAGMESIGDLALRCARFLTETEATVLQTAFRKIEWVRVREYMMGSKRTDAAKKLHHKINVSAVKAGVPL
jgi:hypothetical protein